MSRSELYGRLKLRQVDLVGLHRSIHARFDSTRDREGRRVLRNQAKQIKAEFDTVTQQLETLVRSRFPKEHSSMSRISSLIAKYQQALSAFTEASNAAAFKNTEEHARKVDETREAMESLAGQVRLENERLDEECRQAGEAPEHPGTTASRSAAARAGVILPTVKPPRGPIAGIARGRRYADMFPGVPLSNGGFASVDEFLGALHAGVADPRLTAALDIRAAGTTRSNPDGGFAVPTEYFAQWLDSSLENEIVRPRAQVRPMSSKTAKTIAWDGSDHTEELYGGFAGGWAVEGEDIDIETPQLELMTLDANKLAILCKVSNELIADGISYDAQLSRAIVKALGWFLDRAFLGGTGVGQPLGVRRSPATITVPKEVGQAADTVDYKNLRAIFGRLAPASIPNSVWVCSNSCIEPLLGLSHVVGAGGSLVPVLKESNGTFSILTRPVIFTEKCAKLGDAGDIGLYDFSQYIVGIRADFSLAKSGHVYFASDQSAYRGLIRVDGRPAVREPITPADGGPTVSPFVILGERA